MSAEKRDEDATEERESMSSLIVRALGRPENAVPPAEQGAGQMLEPGPGAAPDSDETFAALLRAIESTVIAENMKRGAPFIAAPDIPEATEPAESDATIPDTTLPIAGQEFAAPAQMPPPFVAQPGKSAPHEPAQSDATISASTLPVDSPPTTATPPQGPASPAQPREPLPGRRHLPPPASQTIFAADEAALESAPSSRSPAVEDRTPAPFIARPKDDRARPAAKIDATTAPADRGGKQFSKWLRSWFSPDPMPDPRLCQRTYNPPLVAYYWTGGTPKPHVVADISPEGLYLVSDDRWVPGTRVTMALQRTDQMSDLPESWIAVDVNVVRWGNDGLGGEFIPAVLSLGYSAARRMELRADKESLERFLNNLAEPSQA
jgi:hypothetical protein